MVIETVSEEGSYIPARRLLDSSSTDYDLKSAAAECEKGASESVPDAQYLHGLFLYTGTAGVIQDKKTAKEMFDLAAAGGHKSGSIVSKEMETKEESVMDSLMDLRMKAEQRDTAACRRMFELYDTGKECVRKDHAEAVRFFTVCAEYGEADAQDTVGFMYLMGKGIKKDGEKARYWLNKSAEQEYPKAMSHLGRMYDEGLGDAEPDFKKSVEWYKKAADKGDVDAQFAMGCICSAPRTRYSSDKEAARYFELAAEQGNAEAAYQIGMVTAYGQGVRRDPAVACKWLEKSAEGGYQQAMVDYANMCFEGQVIPKDMEKAAKWFKTAAEQCNGYAQYALACMYGNGYYFKQSDEEAAKWFREAAEMGEVNSQYCLGCFCYEGRGCTKDLKEAAMWFEESADQGHPGAKAFLGMLQVTGSGVDQDIDAGLQNLNEAAEGGYYEAQYYLGKLYYEGKYVRQNVPRAKRFLNYAAKQGDPDAAALLNKIKSEKKR